MGERLTDAEIEALPRRLRHLAQFQGPPNDDAMKDAAARIEGLERDLAEAHAAIRFAAHACDNTDEWKALHAAAIERAQEGQ